MQRPSVLTRRRALLLAGAGFTPWTRLFAGEFWDKKEPGQWTPDEKDKMLTKSPWAKEVNAQASRDPNQQTQQYPGGGYPGGGYPGGGYPGGGGMGYPRRRGMGYPPGGGMQTYKGTVRWESAEPIIAAAPPTMPQGFEKHYVIATVGFPDLGTPRPRYNDDSGSGSGSGSNSSGDNLDKSFVDELKQYTILQPKGRDLAQAGIVKRKLGNYYFGFSKELITLDSGEHEVDFETRIGRLTIKAKFNMKEMMYKGKLAV
jgi:hypothetical protein